MAHLRILSTATALCLATAALTWALPTDEVRRDFDFWIGEWSVQNRDLQDDGTWKDGDVTRARITPFLGGRALLEEWSGPFHGSHMNGFSLRAFDPERDQWSIMLSWTTDGSTTFGRMNGGFRHGRGEFIARGAAGARTRFTFSDALPRTVRWDQARSQDGGVTWKTDWIMEFTRTAEANGMDADRFFTHPWKEGEVSPHGEARALDWTLGEWVGTIEAGGDEPRREARLRSALVNKDCLVVELLETREKGSKVWVEERLAVRGYVPRAKAWQSIALTRADTVMRRFTGAFEDGRATFEEVTRDDTKRSCSVIADGGDGLVLEFISAGGERRRADLRRAD